VQTEDLGKVFATPRLSGQAEYENERRWLSFDLLCGRVDSRHPFHGRLLRAGIPEADLAAMAERPCPPDIFGINHYLTSERYLDHAWWNYRSEFRGGNGRERYADVEAVRMLHLDDLGPLARLREVWQRYRLPIAITEAHHACSEDEQVRWLLDVWDAARTAAEEGADIRAVTVWSLFGAVDWNSLLTERQGVYEHGPFDIRHEPPRPTLLAQAARDLARFGRHDGRDAVPVGWWRRPERAYEQVRRKRVG
jgi:dTDP-4-dehydrorhamnose reductase